MKNILAIVLYTVLTTATAQNVVITNGDATEAFDGVPSDHTIMYGCESTLKFMHYNGNYVLPGDMHIGRSKITIYGELDYNGFNVFLLCDDSELIISEEALTTPETTLDNMRLYPNPTTGIFYINTNRGFTVDVYNMSGQIVAKTPDLRGLPNGMYLVYVTINGVSVTKKIIKK